MEDMITICELNKGMPCNCPRYGDDCKYCQHIHDTSHRALTEPQVEWAILKMRQGYKTKWICRALYVNDKVLQRNIGYYKGFENLGEVLKCYPPIELTYTPEEGISWKLP